MSFAFIAAEKARFPVRTLCRCLSVAPSGYYAWAQRGPSTRMQQDAVLTCQLRRLHAEHRSTYGRPRLHRALRQHGVTIGAKRVARLMRAAGLAARGRRRFCVTTDRAHAQPVAGNPLARRFAVGLAQTAWAADITACWTQEGWCYLAVVLDLRSRRVIGWAVRSTLATELVTAALHVALARRDRARPLLHHSDRGRQSASGDYQALLRAQGITISMSRVGNCWDNAPVESFFSTLKAECWPDHPWRDARAATAALGDYIDTFYNRRRLHSSLGYQSPAAFEAALAATV